jgi:hypothetical protein
MKYLLLALPISWFTNMDAKHFVRMDPLQLADTILPKWAHNTNIIADSILIDSLSDKIYHLKRVQKWIGASACNISILLPLPKLLDKSYSFNVGYNLEERFQTILFFTYKKQDKKLYFYDIEEDNLIDVTEWDQ